MVEVDVSFTRLHHGRLPDERAREPRPVRSAIRNPAEFLPPHHGPGPADAKQGASFDLPRHRRAAAHRRAVTSPISWSRGARVDHATRGVLPIAAAAGVKVWQEFSAGRQRGGRGGRTGRSSVGSTPSGPNQPTTCIAAAGAPPPARHRRTPIWPTSVGSCLPAARSKSPRPAGTIFCWSGPRGQARR